MKNFVTREEIAKAKMTDLHRYLLAKYPSEVELEKSGVRLKSNHSVSVKVGYRGYYDFATGEGGNAIDCLMKYFGYSFVEAVNSLTDTFYSEVKIKPEEIENAKLSLLNHSKGESRIDCGNISANFGASIDLITCVTSFLIKKFSLGLGV